MEAASVPISSAAALPRLRFAVVAGGGLALAFVVRVALAWRHVTPVYFPDEYLYTALGRSLGHLQGPSVRGVPAHFPALLQPLLTAAAWRIGNVQTAFRAVQVIDAGAFTLAAVPAYLLARTTGSGRRLAIAVAAAALLVPDALYSGFVLAEAVAYPLALGAIAAGVSAIARPRPRSQALFLALSALATFARLQLGILPLCFAAAALVLGLRERRVRAVVREQRLPFALLGLAGLAVVGYAALHGLGYYAGARHLHFTVASLGRNLADLLYAGGWVVMPAAAIGLWLACARPRSRAEAAFGVLTVTTTIALLLEAAVWGDTDLVQERYVFYVLPLVLVAFCCQATRGWPLKRAQVIAAAGLLVLSMRVPLTGWSAPGLNDHAPFLLAFARLEIAAGVTGAAVLVAVVSAAFCATAALAPWRPRLATPLLLGLAMCSSTVSLLAATSFDHLNSGVQADTYLPAVNRSWVDAAGLGAGTLVQAAGSRPIDGEEQLFWNTSVRRVALLPKAFPPDRLGATQLGVGDDGTLSLGAKPLRGPLVVGEDGSTVRFQQARRVAATGSDTLWLPKGNARLQLYVVGRARDGRLLSGGWIDFWSHGPGRLTVSVRGRNLAVGGHTVQGAHTFSFPVCKAGRTTIQFSAPLAGFDHGRAVGGRMGLPRFVPDAHACDGGSANAKAHGG